MISNFLQISLTTKCNKSCSYCPMKEWRNTDDDKYHLTNSVLIPWIEKHIDHTWLIELTGGEPTLYSGLDELLDWLSESGYTVHIRTNGLIRIAPRKGVKRIVAFHDLYYPPDTRMFDEILIIDTTDRQQKERMCKFYDWPYKVIGFNTETTDGAKHHFDKCAFIDPTCHQTGCCGINPIVKIEGGIDVNRLEYSEFKPIRPCDTCKAAIDAWRFL